MREEGAATGLPANRRLSVYPRNLKENPAADQETEDRKEKEV